MEAGFFLKKMIGMWLMPLPFCCLIILTGLAISLRRPRTGRAISLSGTLLLMLFSWQPFGNSVLYPREHSFPAFTTDTEVDTIVVLGNCHNVLPDMPPAAGLCGSSLNRISEGVRIWNANPEAAFLLSGYEGNESRPYAETAYGAAILMGVHPDKIKMFPTAKDTREEAELTYDEVNGKTFALVTDASHMPRAITWFRNLGLNPIPAPAYYGASDHYRDFRISSGALIKTERAWYEWLGEIWQRITG